MSQNSSMSNMYGKMFDMDFMKSMMPMSMPFDISAMMKLQQKNLEALSEAQKMAMENMKKMSEHQAAILSRMVEDNSALARQIMAEGTPEEKVALHADLVCKTVEQSIESWSDLTDMLNKSGKDTTKLLGSRMTASLTEMKSCVGRPEKEKAAA